MPLAIELYDPHGRPVQIHYSILDATWRFPAVARCWEQMARRAGWSINFGDKHVSIALTQTSCYNTNCQTGSILDASQYASPEGLMKIVQ